MLIKYTHGKAVLLFCLLQALTSPVNEILPFSPQRIIIFLFVAFECVNTVLVHRQARASWILYIFFWGSVGVISCLTGSELFENVTDTVYMITTLLILELVQHQDVWDQIQDFTARNRTQVLVILWISVAIVGISALYPTSYESNGAFRGFMYNSHSMASNAILTMSLVVMCIDSRGGTVRRFFCSETFILAINLLIILYTKGRTFLVPAAFLLWRYLKMLPFVKYQRTIIAFCLTAMIVVLFWNQIINKFIEALNNPYAKNTMAAITNFRSELWSCDIAYFLEQNPLRMIFGNGFSFVRDLHEQRLNARLWSHNDITYLLLASGLLGLGVYISMIGRSAVQFFRRKGNFLYFAAMVLFPLLVNGFYIYPHLVWAYFIMIVSQHARVSSMDRMKEIGL